MDPLYFTLGYIAVCYVVVSLVWLVTSPWRKLLVSGGFLSRALQVSVNLTHLASGLFFPLPLPLDIPIRSLGLTILTIGAFVAIWAKVTMKGTWGMPGTHDSRSQRSLTIDGPFRYSRNPIYLGIMLMSFGMAVSLKSAFIFLIFVLYNYFYSQILKEESILVKAYGDGYINYSSETPRFM